VAAVLGALVLMFALPPRDNAEQIARNWVNNNPDIITAAIIPWATPVPLPSNVLYGKIRERVADPSTWVYSTPQKITEDIYRVEARTTFGIALTTPPSYNITAVFRLTVDTASGSVREWLLENVNVTTSP